MTSTLLRARRPAAVVAGAALAAAVLLTAAPASAYDGVAPTATALIEEQAQLGRSLDQPVGGIVGTVAPAPGVDGALPATAAPAPALPPAAEVGLGAISAAASTERITALQQRLTWAGIGTPRTGIYDARTIAGVRLWQAKRVLEVTGRADARTVASLAQATSEDGAIARPCRLPGVVICVDKTQKVLRYYLDGELVRAFDINVGPEKGQREYGHYSSTRVGSFTIRSKERFKVSTLYGTPMHYFMPFDGGIAFHNSAYFRETGYANSSYGCVTAGPVAQSKWLFNHAHVGTRVVVHA